MPGTVLVCIVSFTRVIPSVFEPDPPGLKHDDPRLLPPWRGSSHFCREFADCGSTSYSQFCFHPQFDTRSIAVPNVSAHGGDMTTNAGVLALVADPLLRAELDQVAAAVGTRVVHLSESVGLGRKTWQAASAVVLDQDGARRCLDQDLPRRPAVFLVATSAPDAAIYRTGMVVGAQRAIELPTAATELVAELASAIESTEHNRDGGAMLAVIGGKGGAGASVFAATVAQRAAGALLIDLDPRGGGIDLLLGAEASAGLRWPELAPSSGRLDWESVRQALPEHDGTWLLSVDRHGTELDQTAVEAVVDAGRRGGVTVVCDLPRSAGGAATLAVEAADLVVMVCGCDIRSGAAARATATPLRSLNPNIGLVVRGPSPGGLRAADIADITGLPVLASMRPEPLLAECLERRGLRRRARSPLVDASDQVLKLLLTRPAEASRRVRA